VTLDWLPKSDSHQNFHIVKPFEIQEDFSVDKFCLWDEFEVYKRLLEKGKILFTFMPPPPEPPPRIVRFLTQAHLFQGMLENGDAHNKADLARKFGISRPRVTQIMNLLNLPKRLQKSIGSYKEMAIPALPTERALRPLIGH